MERRRSYAEFGLSRRCDITSVDALGDNTREPTYIVNVLASRLSPHCAPCIGLIHFRMHRGLTGESASRMPKQQKERSKSLATDGANVWFALSAVLIVLLAVGYSSRIQAAQGHACGAAV